MAELKTKENDANVIKFINSVKNDQRREDSLKLLEIFEEVTGEPAKMWGKSIIGFGTYHYIYKTGREGDWMTTGFSPRVQSMTLYIMSGFRKFDSELKKLGSATTAKSCLYIKKLDDVDEKILRKMIKKSYDFIKKEVDNKLINYDLY